MRKRRFKLLFEKYVLCILKVCRHIPQVQDIKQISGQIFLKMKMLPTVIQAQQTENWTVHSNERHFHVQVSSFLHTLNAS